ncbi:MAG: hypothetical protein BroJett030_31300 [Alphaproteobacteria bacterium]|nr:MAG: hypothetical protein BroJett030_31300 [Alphaproteobacteria bacterium]
MNAARRVGGLNLPFGAVIRTNARAMAAAVLAATLTAAMPGLAQAKTYLVNGILSATPIGYGFKNLKQKIPNASLFLMVTGIEAGSIRKTIANDIRKRYKANPDEQFSLAGISAGADVIVQVARDVAQDGIPIFYLGIVEGSGGALPPNVQNADNFICASAGPLCTRASFGGARTVPISTGHIDMGNHPAVHDRIISMAR